MPKRSSFISAYSRQSLRTSHVRQTFLASRVDPPFSGKNASGIRLRAQCAVLPARLFGVRLEKKQFPHGFALSTLCPVCSQPCGCAKNTMGITCLSYTESQDRMCYGRPAGRPVVQTICAGPCGRAWRHDQRSPATPHRPLRRRRRGPLPPGPAARADAPGSARTVEVTVVANTADDLWLHGLKICPDLDTVMYTLGDGIDHDRGWGRRDETWSVKEELAAYGAEAPWFGLGDRDIATHLMRTRMLEAGYPLSAVTEALCRALAGPGVRLLPMSDDRVETHIAIADADAPSGTPGRALPGVLGAAARRGAGRGRASWSGSRTPTPAPGVLEAIAEADVVVVPPSNPVVSVGTILGVPGIRDALRATPAPVVGLSPIVGGTHVRGMAEQLLTSLGVEVSAAGVAGTTAPARADGVLDGWLVDTVDADLVASRDRGRDRLPGRAR